MPKFRYSYFDSSSSGQSCDNRELNRYDLEHHISTVNLGSHRPPRDVFNEICGISNVDENASFNWDIPSTNEDLVVTKHSVLWYQSGILRRKFGFSDNVVKKALFTSFESPELMSSMRSSKRTSNYRTLEADPAENNERSSAAAWRTSRRRALVIILTDLAHVYFLDGAHFVMSIPFTIRDAFATNEGLIIEREITESETVGSQVDNLPSIMTDNSDPILLDPSPEKFPKFFSVIDPMADLGLVIFQPLTSSTYVPSDSSLHNTEDLVFISDIANSPLAVTYERKEDDISILHVYYFRHLITEKVEERHASPGFNRRRSTMSRRKSSMIHTATDELNSSATQGLDISTRTDISLTMDRMGIDQMDSLFPSQLPYFLYETDSLRQEISFSHIESFPFAGDFDSLSGSSRKITENSPIFLLTSSNNKQQALGIMNHKEQYLWLLIFSIPSVPDRQGRRSGDKARINPRFEDSVTIPAISAVKLTTPSSQNLTEGNNTNYIMILSKDNIPYIYSPFLHLLSPSITLHNSVGMNKIMRLLHPIDNMVTLALNNDILVRVKIILSPRSIYVKQAIEVISQLFNPVQRELFKFSWMTSVLQPSSATEPAMHASDWEAFTVALLSWWLGPGLKAEDVPKYPASDVWTEFLNKDSSGDNDNDLDTGEYIQCREWNFAHFFSRRFDSRSDPSARQQFNSLSSEWTLSNSIRRAVSLANYTSEKNRSHLWTQNYRSYVAFMLHLLSEEWKLNVSIPTLKVARKLDIIIGQLIRWMDWNSDWRKRYYLGDSIIFDDGLCFLLYFLNAPA